MTSSRVHIQVNERNASDNKIKAYFGTLHRCAEPAACSQAVQYARRGKLILVLSFVPRDFNLRTRRDTYFAAVSLYFEIHSIYADPVCPQELAFACVLFPWNARHCIKLCIMIMSERASKHSFLMTQFSLKLGYKESLQEDHCLLGWFTGARDP